MQINNIYEPREPRRVIISSEKIAKITEKNKIENNDQQFLGATLKWENNSKYIDLIKSTYKKIPLEIKIKVVQDYFENKELPSTMSKKYSLDVTVIKNLLSKVKSAKLFNYEKKTYKNTLKNSTKKQKKSLIRSIIKEQEGSGCSWKELADKYNVNYQYLIIKKNKYLEKNKHKVIPLQSQSEVHISAQSYEQKIKDLELEIVRLKKIVDHLIK